MCFLGGHNKYFCFISRIKKHSLSHPSEACIVKLVTFNQRKSPFNVLFMSWESFISTERP